MDRQQPLSMVPTPIGHEHEGETDCVDVEVAVIDLGTAPNYDSVAVNGTASLAGAARRGEGRSS